MNILIQIHDTAADKEIKEFTEGNNNKVFITHNTAESISQLSIRLIDKAVISLKSINDAAILKYLNDYYPDVQVVVITNKSFDDIITMFKKVNYSIIHEPLQLSELKTQLSKSLSHN
jgi:hypothetical protein